MTGVSGYIGSRLLPELARRGRPVRCLARRPGRLPGHVASMAEVVPGDVLDAATLTAAMGGVDTAYYLIHSMGRRGDFEALDREAAQNFASAVSNAGVRRIIYLGGLAEEGPDLSAHLRSRHEVGRILRESTAQVIEFRASVIIGGGSLSFELVRALVERLPVMVCPRWVRTLAQPIAVQDVLAYLVAGLDIAHVRRLGRPAWQWTRTPSSGLRRHVAEALARTGCSGQPPPVAAGTPHRRPVAPAAAARWRIGPQ